MDGDTPNSLTTQRLYVQAFRKRQLIRKESVSRVPYAPDDKRLHFHQLCRRWADCNPRKYSSRVASINSKTTADCSAALRGPVRPPPPRRRPTATSAAEIRLQQMRQGMHVAKLAVLHAEEVSIGRTASAGCVSGAEGAENHDRTAR